MKSRRRQKKTMRRDACDDTFTRKLASQSSHINFSTTFLNAIYRTIDKGPGILLIRRNVDKKLTNASSSERKQSKHCINSSMILYWNATVILSMSIQLMKDSQRK